MSTDEVSLSQLRVRCRRGMLELDLILQHYLQHHYATAGRNEQKQFIQLLEMQDPQLYPLLTGITPPPAELAALLQKMGIR